MGGKEKRFISFTTLQPTETSHPCTISCGRQSDGHQRSKCLSVIFFKGSKVIGNNFDWQIHVLPLSNQDPTWEFLFKNIETLESSNHGSPSISARLPSDHDPWWGCFWQEDLFYVNDLASGLGLFSVKNLIIRVHSTEQFIMWRHSAEKKPSCWLVALWGWDYSCCCCSIHCILQPSYSALKVSGWEIHLQCSSCIEKHGRTEAQGSVSRTGEVGSYKYSNII